MDSSFDDSSLVYHKDLVSIADGTEAVSDDEAGSVFHKS